MNNYQNEEIPTHGKVMMKGGLPPNGKSTSSGFNQPYKGMMNDPNRPGSAQVKQTRPFVSLIFFLFLITLNIFKHRLGAPARPEKVIEINNGEQFTNNRNGSTKVQSECMSEIIEYHQNKV